MEDSVIQVFAKDKADKIKLFWSISGDSKPGSLWLFISHIFIPISLIFYGVFIIVAKLESKPAPSSIIDLIFNNPLLTKNSLTYIELWMIYFLLVFLICISSFRKANPKLKKFNEEYQASYIKKISNLFTPTETTIIVTLKISEELHKYATVKIPSDLGLRGDLDFIVGKYYNRLIDRPIFSTYGGKLISNSFFVNLRNESDIIERLDLSSWYNEESAKQDGIYNSLFKIRDILYKKAVFVDYEKGAIVFSKITKLFIFAYKKEKGNFRKSLEELNVLIDEYEKTREPIRGIPLVILKTVKLVIKKRIYFIYFIWSMIIAIGLFVILPPYVYGFLKTRIQNHPSIDLIRNLVFGIVSIYAILLQK
ncbi:MAG: hypothetical protein NTW64_06390 [Candidatus Omnitrophica bacterium]|nr:hypothetical protein [Candidatus Omnitrophota bacterium]